MNDETVRKFGFILAEQVHVMGMQAQNEADKAAGRSLTYTPDCFFASAGLIDRIAHEITG